MGNMYIEGGIKPTLHPPLHPHLTHPSVLRVKDSTEPEALTHTKNHGQKHLLITSKLHNIKYGV